MDFLLVVIELFSLGVTAEALRAIIGSKSAISLQQGPLYPKFMVEGVAPTNCSLSQKTRLNYLSHGIKIWTDVSSVLSQCTCLTDRRTDRNLIARPRLHSMQRGKNGRTENGPAPVCERCTIWTCPGPTAARQPCFESSVWLLYTTGCHTLIVTSCQQLLPVCDP